MKKIISVLITIILLCSYHVSAADELKANVSFSLTNPGHIYFTGEMADVSAKYFNNSSSAMNLSVNINAVGRKFAKVWSYSKTVSLEAYKSQSEVIRIDFAEDIGVYDIYDLTITMTDGTLTKTKTDEFSYVKKGERNDRFGVNVSFEGIDDKDYLDNCMPILKNSGISYVREGLLWSEYEKKKGVYEVPADFENIVNTLRNNDIDILLILQQSNKLYSDDVSYIPKTDVELAGFNNYAKHLVEDMGDRVSSYEIWNEPNTFQGGFNGRGDDGTDYGNLVKSVYPVIKAANPNAYVMGYSASGLNSMINNAAATGASAHMDAGSFHPYPEYDPSGTYAWATGTQLPELTNTYLKGFVNRTGKSNMWITEQGWSDGANKNSEALQAAYIVRAYSLAMQSGYVEKYFWYELIRSALYGDGHEGKFGMLQGRTYTLPLAARPVFLAMSNMNSMLANDDAVQCTEDGTVYKCDFERENGTDLSVVWGTEAASTTLDLGSNVIRKTDLYGNTSYLYSDTGVFTVNADIEPAYYEAAEQFSYEYDTVSGICTIKGFTDSKKANVPINLLVYRPGKKNTALVADEVLNTAAYFDQTVTKDGGMFEYRFSPMYGEGIYGIKLSSKDEELIIKDLDLRSVLTADITIRNKNLSDIAAGESFICDVTVSGTNKVSKEYNVYAALYNGDKLIGVYAKSGEQMSNELSKVTSFTMSADYQIDKIRAFAWEDDMNPLTGAAELLR